MPNNPRLPALRFHSQNPRNAMEMAVLSTVTESLERSGGTTSPPEDANAGIDLRIIILERKAEFNARAEQRRQLALQNIDSGMAPFLAIFPKEVWANILSKIEDPLELETVWKVHPTFRNLSRGPVFSQILEIQFPYSMKNSLRCLSKGVRDAVDRWYENNLMSALHCGGDGDAVVEVPSLIVDFQKNITSGPCKLNDILANLAVGSAKLRTKRFFLHSIQVKFFDIKPQALKRSSFTTFCKKVLTLLQKIGDQVWRFELIIEDIFEMEGNKMPFNEVCEFLRQWSSEMKNLKWLDIHLSNQKNHPEGIHAISKKFKFPILKKLERISFSIAEKNSMQTVEILISILRSNASTIKQLEVYPTQIWSGREHQAHRFISHLLEVMQTFPLKLDRLHFRCHQFACIQLDVLEPIITFGWQQLKDLKIATAQASIESLGKVFHFVNHFPRLEKLSVYIKDITVGGDIPFLRLPNLKHFVIMFRDEKVNFQNSANVVLFYSLQYLLHSKKLKTIIWDNDTPSSARSQLESFMQEQEGRMDILGFGAGFKNLKNSNIWQVFPLLESVKVVTTVEQLEESVVRENPIMVPFRNRRLVKVYRR